MHGKLELTLRIFGYIARTGIPYLVDVHTSLAGVCVCVCVCVCAQKFFSCTVLCGGLS